MPRANDKLYTYQEVIKHLHDEKRQKHLLLGNGFSMSYDSKIFSYNALSKYIEKLDNEILQKLFNIVKTSNFELIMQQLDNTAKISSLFGATPDVVEKVNAASTTLKQSLIDAIKELHPEHVFEIPENRSKACATFLNQFLSENGNVFTTNYDLLLYWVLLRNDIQNKVDGFGRDVEETGGYVKPEDVTLSELRWGKYRETQTVHFLHGGLQLFDAGVEIIKEEYSGVNYLLTAAARKQPAPSKKNEQKP